MWLWRRRQPAAPASAQYKAAPSGTDAARGPVTTAPLLRTRSAVTASSRRTVMQVAIPELVTDALDFRGERAGQAAAHLETITIMELFSIKYDGVPWPILILYAVQIAGALVAIICAAKMLMKGRK